MTDNSNDYKIFFHACQKDVLFAFRPNKYNADPAFLCFYSMLFFLLLSYSLSFGHQHHYNPNACNKQVFYDHFYRNSNQQKQPSTTCYGLASILYLNYEMACSRRHEIDLPPINALEIHFNSVHLTE